jgi:hypothetical protein
MSFPVRNREGCRYMNLRTTGIIMLTGAAVLMGAGESSDPRPVSANAPGADADSRTPVPGDGVATAPMVSDAPLDAYRIELLDIAFGAASAMPLEPHIRNRSRAQEVVVGACFSLEQPQRALRYADLIANWIRGSCYVEYALYCAQRGATADVQQYLDRAAAIVQDEEDWRRDVVRTKTAQTYLWLGQLDKAVALETGVVDSEVGKVNAVRAVTIQAADFDALMIQMSVLAGTNNFDALRNTGEAYLRLFDRFYADDSRRALIEQRLRGVWSQLPVIVRVDLMTALAALMLEHEDTARALEIVNEAQANVDGRQWLANDRLPMEARLARLRWLAGNREKARRDNDALLAAFEAERHQITNIYRAETLCPIAECYHAMGDDAASMNVYRRAVEEGIENPNLWPRADDLSATCCSMAVCGVEPDAELWTRIREIREGLSDPW